VGLCFCGKKKSVCVNMKSLIVGNSDKSLKIVLVMGVHLIFW
jgi:hypothetical protein